MLYRNLLTALLLLLGLSTASAQLTVGENAEMGIDQHLGNQVPMDLTFLDGNGQPVRLGDLIDRPTILTLVYFTCPGICTPLLNELAATLDLVKETPGKEFQVLSVSFNPEDPPEVAGRKQNNYQGMMQREIPEDGWRFLVGEQEQIDRLTRAVGFKYTMRDGEFDHPGVLIVLSPEGVISRYMQGTTFQPSDLQMALYEAKQGRVGESRPVMPAPISGSSKILSFCMSLDPESNKYVFDIQKVAGGGILLGALGFVGILVISGRRSGRKQGEEENHGG